MQGAVREIALEVVRADGSRLPVLVNSDAASATRTASPLLIRTTVFDATDRRSTSASCCAPATASARRASAPSASARITAIAGRRARPAADRGRDRRRAGREHRRRPGGARARRRASRRRRRARRRAGGWEPPEAGWRTRRPASTASRGRADGARAVGLAARGRTAGRSASCGSASRRRAPFSDGGARVPGRRAPASAAQALERVRLHERDRARRRAVGVPGGGEQRARRAPGLERRAQRLVDLVVARVADGASRRAARGRRRTTLAVAARDADLRDRRAGAGARLTPRSRRRSRRGEPQLLHGPRRPALRRRAAPLASPRCRCGRAAACSARSTLTSFEPEPRLRRRGPAVPERPRRPRGARARERAALRAAARRRRDAAAAACSPGEPPRDPRFEVATQYRPAVATLEVGGDWYDTFAVGDGTDRRSSSATWSAAASRPPARWASCAARCARWPAPQLGPARLIEHLDAFVERVETARYATLAYAEIELDSGRDALRLRRPSAAAAGPAGQRRRGCSGRAARRRSARSPALRRTEAALTLEPRRAAAALHRRALRAPGPAAGRGARPARRGVRAPQRRAAAGADRAG